MITQPLPPELGQFVEQQLALGKYQSEQELVVNAVRVLREVETQQRQFHGDIQLGIDQLERGEANEYSLDQLRERFERLKDRARQRVAGGKEIQ
jgi:putative addiction module CopG family antidote